jgi:hypothetical protein
VEAVAVALTSEAAVVEVVLELQTHILFLHLLQ